MTTARPDIPSGTVTFLFTDIEGSTRLLHQLGARRYAEALQEHREVLREAFARHGGVEVDTEGDAFFVAFADAAEAVAAAKGAQEVLASGPIRVRMGLHTGTPHVTAQGYVGVDVHKGARIAAAAHGGQLILSKETRQFLGDGFELTDLGEHRVKDFVEPIWIYQLGVERFPPLKTISNTNLPRPASSFVGREHEVAELTRLLRDGARLLSLTGPGGSGKTRLAIEAAAELVPDFKAGVFWVGLAAIRDPTLVTEIVAQTLGAKEGLAEHIGERQMLLLLDNLEQVVGAAPELAALVEACPNLRVLSTTRELLRVRGEVEYPVLPLAEPEAVELFCARAQLAADEAIHELCARLDNLPLALELAAARASVLTPAQILERLSQRLDLLRGGRDADPRQATLRATIEWSHALLSADEKDLFARLSVFRGGWTLAAAEAVCSADLDVLASLVDKSLLRRSEDRFTMLETIREFAAERLEASGEAEELHRRHADFFVALAGEARPHIGMGGDDPGRWYDDLDADHDNLRAALDQLGEARDGEREQRLAAVMWPFWLGRGHYREARPRLDHAIGADEAPTTARAWVLFGAAVMSDDDDEARGRFHEALALFDHLDDAFGAARVRMNLATLAMNEGDFERGREGFEQSIRAFEELGEEHWAAINTRMLAWAYYELGDRPRTRALREAAVRRARAIGNLHLEADALGGLGEDAVTDGQLAEAIPALERSTRIFIELKDPLWVAISLCRFARAMAVVGHPDLAAQLLARGEAMHGEIGRRIEPWLVLFNDEVRTAIGEALDETSIAEAMEQGRKASVEAVFSSALRRLGGPGAVDSV